MISRFYADNYLCLSNFELEPSKLKAKRATRKTTMKMAATGVAK